MGPQSKMGYEDFHLTEAMADKAITWMRRHRALNPDRPFLMWWTPGAVHGPHHVAQEWADKYKGKFSDGWDAYQQRVFERQKAVGWIPADTKLAPRPEGMPAWEEIPEDERAFQERLMEVYAFLEHTDVQVGKLIDELEAQGIRDNTLVIYIVSDNGASAEGMQGTVAELNAQNGIPSTVAEHIAVVEKLGGIEAIGGPSMDNMYHSAWAWAGDRPFRYTKLIAADWGGTRTPMVISWPARIKPDTTPSTEPASPTPSARRLPRAGRRPNTSTSWAAAASTTRAGWPAPSARANPGWPMSSTSANGIPCRTNGSCSIPGRTSR
jgi:arylsulfatase A-like enzyme